MRPEARPIKFTNGHARSYVKIENEVDTTDMQNNPLQQCYSSPISREKHRLGNTAVLSSATFNAPESSRILMGHCFYISSTGRDPFESDCQRCCSTVS